MAPCRVLSRCDCTLYARPGHLSDPPHLSLPPPPSPHTLPVVPPRALFPSQSDVTLTSSGLDQTRSGTRAAPKHARDDCDNSDSVRDGDPSIAICE
ncbi:hypothetical protein FA95DRAFT_562626 [Auriscalpium vulgare]|uniref:Uncharacterized protein n=1 Tax=Auriscalpium vulgare TaxID=40419 RepID=A0ACB8RE54_9AGAM|nr:hypothetical protein FA95DRAFT_562626 [Auriscalpium vulgare]